MKTLSNYKDLPQWTVFSSNSWSSSNSKALKPSINYRHTTVFMQRLVDFIEQQIDNPDLCLAKVSQALHVSNMQLYRRVKQCSGISPNQFIRTLRLQRGRQLLRTTDWNISEIAYSVGFNDPNYFTRSFSQEFNLSPTSYRTKISQSSAVPV